MGTREQYKPSLLTAVAAEALLRLCYFIMTFVGLTAGTALVGGLLVGRRDSASKEGLAPILRHTVLTEFPTSPFWVLLIALSVLSAALGPGAYRRHRDRGRGQLATIRELSRMAPIRPHGQDSRGGQGD